MKYKRIISILAIISMLNIGCSNNKATSQDAAQDNVMDNRYSISSVLGLNWQQQSGEFDALCYQAYNFAIKSLEENTSKPHDKPMAVVLDVDETVLDNSISSGEDIKANRGFTEENFTEWVSREDASLVSGADKFLNRAKELGVEIFYVTNRIPKDVEATINNMNRLKLPNADKEHILVKTDSSSKQSRWDEVSKKYEIVMYCGDNLNDFNNDFYKKSNKDRKKLVQEMENEFGSKYIILPNALYGDWEIAMYDYDNSKSNEEKYEVRYNLINENQ